MARRRKIGLKNLAAGALAIMMVAGAIAGIVALTGKDFSTVSDFSFTVGALNANGRFVEFNQSIVSDYFECQGLTIEPTDSASGTFQVFYYNEDKEFVGDSAIYTSRDGVYKADYFAMFRYARVVITPDAPIINGAEDDAFRIRFYEVSKYARGWDIRVDKKQAYVSLEKRNVFDEASVVKNVRVIGTTFQNILSDSDSWSLSPGVNVLRPVAVPEYATLLEVWYKPSGMSADNFVIATYDENGDILHWDDGNLFAKESDWYVFRGFVSDASYISCQYANCKEIFITFTYQ